MMFLFALLLVALWCDGGETRRCGDPPQCECYSVARVVDCKDVGEGMPAFPEIESRLYRTLYLAGQMRRGPDLTAWTGLERVDAERTLIPCPEVRLWQQSAPFRVVARRCTNMTGMYLISADMVLPY